VHESYHLVKLYDAGRLSAISNLWGENGWRSAAWGDKEKTTAKEVAFYLFYFCWIIRKELCL